MTTRAAKEIQKTPQPFHSLPHISGQICLRRSVARANPFEGLFYKRTKSRLVDRGPGNFASLAAPAAEVRGDGHWKEGRRKTA